MLHDFLSPNGLITINLLTITAVRRQLGAYVAVFIPGNDGPLKLKMDYEPMIALWRDALQQSNLVAK